MMDTETIATSARPRRRLWVWSALIAGAGLLIAGSWLGYIWYLNRDLERAIAEADRLDPGWRLMELEAARAEIPDEENAALQVLAAKKLLPAGWLVPPPGSAPMTAEFLPLSPIEPLNAALSQRLGSELEKASAAVKAARKVADMPRGRYVVIWSRDAIGTLVPHVQDARQVAELLQCDAFQRIQEGDIDGCLAACTGILNTGRSLGDESAAVSQLVRLLCERLALRALERGLAHGEASESALQAFQRLLEDEAQQPLLLVAARAERAGVHQFLEVVEARKIDRASYGLRSRTGMTQVDDLLDRGKARGSHAPYLRFLNQCVEIAKLPPEVQIERLKRLDMKEPEIVPDLLAGLTRHSGFKIIARGFHYTLALGRCGISAVAIERFRLANGRWPDQLDDLVPRFLSKVPTDPFDGQPLRFRRLKDGVIVYTVGEDQQDDGGRRVRIKAGAPDRDVGFQLWDPEHRRQPPGKE